MVLQHWGRAHAVREHGGVLSLSNTVQATLRVEQLSGERFEI